LPPGQSGFAQLRFRHPLLVLPGDRFIIRQFSPVVTIGGGVIIDADPQRSKTPTSARIAELEVLSSPSRDLVLIARIARRLDKGLKLAEAVAETGWPDKDVEAVSARLVAGRRVLRVGDMLISAPVFENAKTFAFDTVDSFHKSNPLAPGIAKGELAEKLGLEETVFNAVLDSLVRDKKLETSAEIVRAAGRGVVMKDEEAESKKIIENAFASAGLKVPALKDVLAGVKVDRVRAQKIVTLLLRDRVLVKLSDDLVFHRNALDQLRRLMAGEKARSTKIDVAKFKELTGVSRKYAIPLLEYLDRERVTRRVGDLREIL
ncbi:MAG TPA: SelB C-terminal domain-containing protein, partial [Terriglobales bacterium]